MFVVATEFHDAFTDVKVFEQPDDARAFLKFRLAALAEGALVQGELPKRVSALRVAASDAREAKRLVEQRKAAVLVDSADQASIEEPYEAF